MKDSPAMAFLRHMWKHSGHQMGHSWDRLNHAMWRTLILAIDAGLQFRVGDFEKMCAEESQKGFRAGYWIGATSEMIYTTACKSEKRGAPNMSACLAYEAWMNRKPYILDDNRLCVGSRFKWFPKGDMVTVNSFKKDDTGIIACTYKPPTDKYEPAKIDKRYTITHADIAEYRKKVRDLRAKESKRQATVDAGVEVEA